MNNHDAIETAFKAYEQSVLTDLRLSALERKCLELEMGPGGDHDLPYSFSLPLSMPQTLAWLQLMAEVQSGALQL